MNAVYITLICKGIGICRIVNSLTKDLRVTRSVADGPTALLPAPIFPPPSHPTPWPQSPRWTQKPSAKPSPLPWARHARLLPCVRKFNSFATARPRSPPLYATLYATRHLYPLLPLLHRHQNTPHHPPPWSKPLKFSPTSPDLHPSLLLPSQLPIPSRCARISSSPSAPMRRRPSPAPSPASPRSGPPTEAEHFSTATLVPLHLVSFAALHPSLWSAYLSSSIDLALDALDALSDLDLPTPRDDTEGIEEIFRAHVACGTAFSHLLEILVPRGRSTRDGPMSMGRSTVEVLLPKAQTLLARAHGTGHLIVTRTAEHVLARIVSLMHHHHQHPSPEGSEDHDT